MSKKDKVKTKRYKCELAHRRQMLPHDLGGCTACLFSCHADCSFVFRRVNPSLWRSFSGRAVALKLLFFRAILWHLLTSKSTFFFIFILCSCKLHMLSLWSVLFRAQFFWMQQKLCYRTLGCNAMCWSWPLPAYRCSVLFARLCRDCWDPSNRHNPRSEVCWKPLGFFPSCTR